jgi:hypothetical protein
MKSRHSTALDAADAIGAMVKQGTRTTGKSLLTKKKMAASKTNAKKPTTSKPAAEVKPEPKKTASKPTKAPVKKTTAKKTEPKIEKKLYSEPKPNFKFTSEPVDLSFDKPNSYKVTDKRTR